MIEVKFSSLNIGDKYYNLIDKGGVRTMTKTGDRTLSSPCNDYTLDVGQDFNVWVKRFSDRYNKDLSIGDRILTFHLDSGIKDIIINTILLFKESEGVRELYVINEKDGGIPEEYSFFPEEIIKIEKNWGI